MTTSAPISSLLSRGAGHRMVIYGDCCSGVPGAPSEATFARVDGALRRLDLSPEFILFPGDHISGSPDEPDAFRRQWRYFFEHEMAWLDRAAVPFYSCTSNHNTRGPQSEAVWREVFSDLPRNGPEDQIGLSYWVRRGDLLLVVVNTSFSGLGGNGHVECAWLDAVLAQHYDARHKLVMGHYPVWPVNGYDEAPLWRIVPDQGQGMWRVLQARGVTAYLCSHVIAFDAQEHDGVLQLTTGGAGTNYGPGGFMDGPDEYHHFVQAVLDDDGLRCQSVDPDGRVRELVEWKRDGKLWQARE